MDRMRHDTQDLVSSGAEEREGMHVSLESELKRLEAEMTSASHTASERLEGLTSGVQDMAQKSVVDDMEVRMVDSLLELREKCGSQEEAIAEVLARTEETATEVQKLKEDTRWTKQDLLNLYGVPELPPEVVERLESADANGDEELSVKEFLEDRSRGGKRRREWKPKDS
jgi:CII-binding regulator of phage lambda lysogenization HflD